MAKSVLVGVRLSPEDVAKIDKLIEQGEFGDRGEFLRYCVRKKLLENTDRLSPPND